MSSTYQAVRTDSARFHFGFLLDQFQDPLLFGEHLRDAARAFQPGAHHHEDGCSKCHSHHHLQEFARGDCDYCLIYKVGESAAGAATRTAKSRYWSRVLVSSGSAHCLEK